MSKALSTLQLALLAQRAREQRNLLAAEPIAVVGVGCRFPTGDGQADITTPEAFWSFLQAGEDAVTEVPLSRWSLDRYYDPRPGTPGKMHCRHGSFLASVDQFDPARFGISPREAEAMDPQHRLLLEVAQEALERAALTREALRGMAAGVYLGLCTSDYAWRQLQAGAPETACDLYFATGTTLSMAAGRLAYCLGLQGPAMAVDTACSSSLVAVDLACRSLRDRDTDLAIAGGVSVLLSPLISLCFSRGGMLAPDGKCKTFDAAADGYVRGEGCGVVVLKRLADALVEGDPVLAVVRGSGVNQDGASAGMTVPSGDAQARLIERTLLQAQLDGNDIDVLEAHGTGTALGDPIELKALAPIYAKPQRNNPLWIGSVKTNFGHLEGAAGIAGLLKAIMMVHYGRIPPHLHLRQPTPYFSWNKWKITVPTALESWPNTGDRPRRVAVSSFGFSGTNAHVLVEQPPLEVKPREQLRPALLLNNVDLLLLSAQSKSSLLQLARNVSVWLAHQASEAWPSICATSRCARSSMPWRLAITAPSILEAIKALDSSRVVASIPPKQPRVAFRLTQESSEQDWKVWTDFGIEATALIYQPGQARLAASLAGSPPRLRIEFDREGIESDLEDLGYGLVLPLEPPTLEHLVELWQLGIPINWDSLQPTGAWQRHVLPTTPFDHARFWFNELEDAKFQLINLEHRKTWRPLEGVSVFKVKAPLLLLSASPESRFALAKTISRRVVIGCPDFASLDLALAKHPLGGNDKPDVLLAAAANPTLLSASTGGLGDDFWSVWLPLLQGLIARASQLGRVHWWIPGDDANSEAVVALARSWSREAGSLSGLILRHENPEELFDLIDLSMPSASELRIGTSGVEIATLEPLADQSTSPSPLVLQPGSTTLITGGLGALGLACAQVLSQCGARHLILVARRAPDVAQQDAINSLEKSGVTVEVVQLDISDQSGVRELFHRIRESGRPLAGIIHAAGVVDDALIMNLTIERCSAVTRAKVRGALLLDYFSRSVPHDFFVVYSSLAAVLGSPGQLPYSAANGFLEGLIRERCKEGLPGLSLAWGPWAGDGMAAQAAVAVEQLQVEEALTLLKRWLGHKGDPNQVVLARLGFTHDDSPIANRLRELAMEISGLATSSAQRATERCLASILAEICGVESNEIQQETRLDALGFDSLMAVELATAVQAGLGLNLGLGALVGEPTLEGLAAHLVGLLNNSTNSDNHSFDLGAESQLPEDLRHALDIVSESRDAFPEAVLLTGATGFLGAFILADQLKRHSDLTIYCLVRADGVAAAKTRVRANLERYGLWDEAWSSRVVGVAGDLALPRLGLDASTWDALALRLSGILHSGAQLSYVASYGQLRAPNVGGTLEVLRLAMAPAAHGLPPMHIEYISSTAVYEAASYRGKVLDERSDIVEWEGIHLGYSQTKWVSERLVIAAAHSGLSVRIFRPPLIGGHSETGAWHEQDFLHRLMLGCLALGQAPLIPMELDLVPVDYVVASVGALSWRPVVDCPEIFHLHHPSPTLWTDFLRELIALGAPLQPVELQPWLEALAADPANPLYPLQPFFTHRWGPEQFTYPELNQPGLKAKPSCTYTCNALKSFDVRCPSFEELLYPYARTFLGVEFDRRCT